jgi:hypothetical protein
MYIGTETGVDASEETFIKSCLKPGQKLVSRLSKTLEKITCCRIYRSRKRRLGFADNEETICRHAVMTVNSLYIEVEARQQKTGHDMARGITGI